MVRGGSLAARYLARLLAFDQEGALALVRGALDHGMTLRALYLDVLEPVQHEIGKLWETNRLSVAHEHYCTAITQFALAEAYPRTLRPAQGARRLVATTVPGELHQIGGRMVADFFELQGWQTTYLGDPADVEQVLRTLCEAPPQLLCISITMLFNLPAAGDLIRLVRARPECDDVKILIGGRALLHGEDWRALGADGYAIDADRAVELGHMMVGTSAGSPS